MVEVLEDRQVLEAVTTAFANPNPGLKEIGQTVYYPLQYKRLLTETGFKNITERKYAGQFQKFRALSKFHNKWHPAHTRGSLYFLISCVAFRGGVPCPEPLTDELEQFP